MDVHTRTAFVTRAREYWPSNPQERRHGRIPTQRRAQISKNHKRQVSVGSVIPGSSTCTRSSLRNCLDQLHRIDIAPNEISVVSRALSSKISGKYLADHCNINFLREPGTGAGIIRSRALQQSRTCRHVPCTRVPCSRGSSSFTGGEGVLKLALSRIISHHKRFQIWPCPVDQCTLAVGHPHERPSCISTHTVLLDQAWPQFSCACYHLYNLL